MKNNRRIQVRGRTGEYGTRVHLWGDLLYRHRVVSIDVLCTTVDSDSVVSLPFAFCQTYALEYQQPMCSMQVGASVGGRP
jgi:hypothetical protein